MPNTREAKASRASKATNPSNPSNGHIGEAFRNPEAGYKVGGMIRAMRESAGLSQDQLADRLSTKRSAISRWENRAEDIKLSTMVSIASQLGFVLQVDALKKAPLRRNGAAHSTAKRAPARAKAG